MKKIIAVLAVIVIAFIQQTAAQHFPTSMVRTIDATGATLRDVRVLQCEPMTETGEPDVRVLTHVQITNCPQCNDNTRNYVTSFLEAKSKPQMVDGVLKLSPTLSKTNVNRPFYSGVVEYKVTYSVRYYSVSPVTIVR